MKLFEEIRKIHHDTKKVEFKDGTVIMFYNKCSEHISKDKMGFHYSGSYGNITKFIETEEEAIDWVKYIGRVKVSKTEMKFHKAMNSQPS